MLALLCVLLSTFGHVDWGRDMALAAQTITCSDPPYGPLYRCVNGVARVVAAGATSARTSAGQLTGVMSAFVMPVRNSTVCVAAVPGLSSRVV